jgi:ribosomal protein RSM22 (predicted rRNA methylase)
MRVPDELERAVYAAVGREPPVSELVHAIVERSRRYTSERDRLGAAGGPGDLLARALFFTIADAMKVVVPVRELAARGALPARRPLRVVDLGAGCGAMTLGLLTVTRELDVVAIDRDRAALAIAAAAARELAGVAIATRTGDVATVAIPACDLVVMGSVLNELAEPARLAVVERALAAIADDGAVIVVEPALRDTARALHAVRDAVIARGSGHVFAPCTRRGAPCPALADPDDWCHEDRPLELPPRTAELARLTHLRDSGMKLAYLVLRRAPLDLVDDPAAWRIVSAPRPSKGKLEIYGCSERGRMPLRLLKRHRSADNRELERAERGDVVTIDGAAPELAADSRVVRVPRDRS